jgi:hypothetical protein
MVTAVNKTTEETASPPGTTALAETSPRRVFGYLEPVRTLRTGSDKNDS